MAAHGSWICTPARSCRESVDGDVKADEPIEHTASKRDGVGVRLCHPRASFVRDLAFLRKVRRHWRGPSFAHPKRVAAAARRGVPNPGLFLAKRKDAATAAVPDEFCDEMSLVGRSLIRERYRAWAECAITGLTIVTEQPEAMELMARLTRVEPRRRKT